VKEDSIVRNNLMEREGYSPYCGNDTVNCPWPRTHFDGEQFICKHCGWRSSFPEDFMERYKAKWKIKESAK
jgi:hypothetical protein